MQEGNHDSRAARLAAETGHRSVLLSVLTWLTVGTTFALAVLLVFLAR